MQKHSLQKIKGSLPDCKGDKSGLKDYLEMISRFPKLSKEEEKEIISKWEETRKKEFSEKLVCANLRLVVSNAFRLSHTRIPIMDLIQAGNIGLCKAVERYDSRKGTKFSNYAGPWIDCYIYKYLRDNVSSIKYPLGMKARDILAKFTRTKKRLEQSGKDASPENMADEFGVEKSVIEEMISFRNGEINFSTLSSSMEDGSTDLYEMISRKSMDVQEEVDFSYNIDKEMVLRKCKGVINDFAKTLSSRNKEFFVERCLKPEDERITTHELGKRYGITKQAVSFAVAQILLDFKKFAETKLNEDELSFFCGSDIRTD